MSTQPAAVNLAARRIEVVRADQVPKKRILWLWKNYIPLDCTTAFVGLPGHGKSLVTCAIVAAVTAGKPFPDDKESPLPPSDVLILSTEDDPASILVPRLEAAGADLTRVHIIKSAVVGTKDAIAAKDSDRHQVALDQDREAIHDIFHRFPNIRLFVIDPITDAMGKTSILSETEVRSLLYGIASSGVSVLIVGHLNKKTGLSAQQRSLGAGAFIGKSRASFLLASDDPKKVHFHMLPLKCNYGHPAGLHYTIETIPMEIEGATDDIPLIRWRGTSDKDANSILEQPQTKKKSALLIAIEFLQALLRSGPRPATSCENAAVVQGISDTTLRRAKATLGVESTKTGKPNEKGEPTWVWTMRKPFFVQETGG